jgi:lysozyme family protein
MTLEEIVEKTLGHEGGYVNDPRDSGGETIWGITLATARRFGYTGPMRSMPRAEAVRIYIEQYMKGPKIDKLNAYSSKVCFEVYDTGVNAGPERAIEFLQTALNILNRQGKDYPDLTVDGSLGPRTFSALEAFLKLRKIEGELVLVKILNVLQGAFYIDLATRREKDEAFILGWFRTRIDIPTQRL